MAAEPQTLDPHKVAEWFKKWDFGPMHQNKHGLFNVNVYERGSDRDGLVDIGQVSFVSTQSYNRVRMYADIVVSGIGAFEIRAPEFHVQAEPIAQANSKLLADSFKKTLDVFAELAIRHGR